MAVKPCGFERLLRKVAFTRETCVVGIRGFVIRELSIAVRHSCIQGVPHLCKNH